MPRKAAGAKNRRSMNAKASSRKRNVIFYRPNNGGLVVQHATDGKPRHFDIWRIRLCYLYYAQIGWRKPVENDALFRGAGSTEKALYSARVVRGRACGAAATRRAN